MTLIGDMFYRLWDVVLCDKWKTASAIPMPTRMSKHVLCTNKFKKPYDRLEKTEFVYHSISHIVHQM